MASESIKHSMTYNIFPGFGDPAASVVTESYRHFPTFPSQELLSPSVFSFLLLFTDDLAPFRDGAMVAVATKLLCAPRSCPVRLNPPSTVITGNFSQCEYLFHSHNDKIKHVRAATLSEL